MTSKTAKKVAIYSHLFHALGIISDHEFEKLMNKKRAN